MNKVLTYLRYRRDAALLAISFLLLIAAAFNPTIPLPRNIYSYVLVADISQSMNVVDTRLNGKETSRLDYTKFMMHRVVANMPCGTKVSLGLFAGATIAALFNPIEVCSNYDAIQDTIDHLEWRSAWSGNSRLRESLYMLSRVIRSFPEPAQVVYFTDGEEAPKLGIFNTKDLTNFQGGNGWLFVGIGSEKGNAIPKLDDKNQLIGYWAIDSFAIQPGISQISEANLGGRNNDVAGGTGDRYISTLQEQYLKSLSKEISGDYVRGDSLQSILTAMEKQKPSRRDIAAYNIQWILALFAAFIFLSAYITKDMFRNFKKRFIERRK
jgi:mxaL protein